MNKIVVIGGMKCGTSSLYQMFKEVDEVCLSKFKEPSFFTKRTKNGINWYKNQFEATDKTKYLMDVSPSYSKIHLFPNCPKMIHDYDSDTKVIYLVRDPLDRIISNIYHDLLRGRLTRDQIQSLLVSDENYIKTSAYMSQILPYLELFGEKNILILQFEEFKSNMTAFNKKIADFLELDFKVDNVKAQNVSENRFLIKHYDFFHSRFGNGFVSKIYFLYCYFLNRRIEKPQLTKEELSFIYEKLRNDIEEFIQKFHINESAWNMWISSKNKI
jgi:hypothetical protein